MAFRPAFGRRARARVRGGVKKVRAFVVGSGTMDRVVWAICARGGNGHRIRRFAGVPTNAANARTEIGRRLRIGVERGPG